MHVGLVMECDYRMGVTQEEAFDEAFAMADVADEFGLDGVWLAERHFAAPRRPGDPMGAGIPSVVSVPLVMASAIAGRTKQVRIGTGVSVLPLCHPVRLAEEAATVDQVSRGRLEFGVGRSGFPRSYDGYGIPYAESRARFAENLDIILRAWSEERFSYEGEFYQINDLCVLPKPYQQPHPPIRIAATTRDTFPRWDRAVTRSFPAFAASMSTKSKITCRCTTRDALKPVTMARAKFSCGCQSTWRKPMTGVGRNRKKAPCAHTDGWVDSSALLPTRPGLPCLKNEENAPSGWPTLPMTTC